MATRKMRVPKRDPRTPGHVLGVPCPDTVVRSEREVIVLRAVSELISSVVNFEVPSAKPLPNKTGLNGLAHSNQAALDEALMKADLPSLYQLYTPMEVVPRIFGGIIPTDIQGIYRNGVLSVEA